MTGKWGLRERIRPLDLVEHIGARLIPGSVQVAMDKSDLQGLPQFAPQPTRLQRLPASSARAPETLAPRRQPESSSSCARRTVDSQILGHLAHPFRVKRTPSILNSLLNTRLSTGRLLDHPATLSRCQETPETPTSQGSLLVASLLSSKDQLSMSEH